MPELEDVVKDTAKLMGKVVKRPPMTTKLLSKPPFRFLHDTLMEVIKNTGFLEGLFTADEQVSDNVKEKPLKLAFLQKAIDCTALATGRSLHAKPSKIVAGQDPMHTNLWLQAIAKGVRDKIDTTDAVTQVLSGKAPSTSDKKEKSRRSKADKEEKKSSRSKDEKKSSSSSKEREHRSARKDRSESARKDEERSGSARKSEERSGSARKGKEETRRSSARKEKDRHSEEPEAKDEPQGQTTAAAAEPQERSVRSARPHSARGSRKSGASHSADDSQNPAEGHQDQEEPKQEQKQQQQRHKGEEDSKANHQHDESYAAVTAGAVATTQEDSQPINDVEHLPGGVQKSVRRVRPSSARRAPPKAKKGIEGEDPNLRIGSASSKDVPVVQVLKAGEDDDDEEDDEEEMKENGFDLSSAPVAAHVPMTHDDDQDDGEHGALMRKIMDKKGKDEDDGGDGGGVSNRQASEAATREITQMRTAIQNLCRSTNPLGKVIDYMQEDVDTMHKEFKQWVQESNTHKMELADESQATANSLQPLRAKLRELNKQIQDKENALRAANVVVHENDQKIQKMLASVGVSAAAK